MSLIKRIQLILTDKASETKTQKNSSNYLEVSKIVRSLTLKRSKIFSLETKNKSEFIW